jgi:hypothetical protein
MNISDLRDLKLTNEEWYTLTALQAGLGPRSDGEDGVSHVDMLVLAGLVEHDGEHYVLTVDGCNAATEIDMIFDWEEFVHRPSKRSDAVAEALASPKRMTVGSLVRHKTTGGVGLITHHMMWDADWGGFRVQFSKPVDNVVGGRVLNQLTHISDRGDKFEFAY